MNSQEAKETVQLFYVLEILITSQKKKKTNQNSNQWEKNKAQTKRILIIAFTKDQIVAYI
jgi:hypothetical protein